MQYLITFLEGLISFLSPCMLPMLPVYLSYFAGNADKKHRVLLRAGCFVLGFTLVFSLMGLFAGTLSTLLMRHQTVVNIVTGIIVIVFGLSYLEIIPLPFLRGMPGPARGYRRIFRLCLWHDLLSQPHAVRRRIPRVRADAGFHLRHRGTGRAAVAGLFAGPGRAVLALGGFD